MDGAEIYKRAGRTPLHIAAWHGHTDEIMELLKSGADVNAKDRDGVTPLWYAADLGNEECVRVLIAAGADVNVENPSGYTALATAKISLHWTASDDYRQIVNLLKRAGAH